MKKQVHLQLEGMSVDTNNYGGARALYTYTFTSDEMIDVNNLEHYVVSNKLSDKKYNKRKL